MAPEEEQVLTDAMKTLLQAKQNEERSALFEAPTIHSSWDDLTDGIETKADWHQRRTELKEKYLKLLRDQYKPQKPALDLKVHEEVIVEGLYRRQLISYAVESDERAHAYLGIPLNLTGKAPAIVALHGTYEFGAKQAAGLIDNPDKAYLDHLCRRLLMLMKIMDIYELKEAPQNFAFYIHGRGHSVAHESRQLMYGWLDAHLKPPEATQTRLVTPELETAIPAASQ